MSVMDLVLSVLRLTGMTTLPVALTMKGMTSSTVTLLNPSLTSPLSTGRRVPMVPLAGSVVAGADAFAAGGTTGFIGGDEEACVSSGLPDPPSGNATGVVLVGSEGR